MKLYVVCDYSDCECHGVRGIFTTEQAAYDAFKQTGFATKEEVMAALEEDEDYYGDEKVIFEGEGPYYWSMSCGNEITFSSITDDYLGGYDLEEVEIDMVFPDLLG